LVGINRGGREIASSLDLKEVERTHTSGNKVIKRYVNNNM
jgi:hypothetical protein